MQFRLINSAITIFKENDQYIITLGATQEISNRGGALAGAVVCGLVTGIANNTFYQYNAYTYTKSARFQMVLDRNLHFLPNAEVPLNVFDEISEFTQQTSPKVLQTVFKLNNTYIWSTLNPKEKTLNFFTF